LRLLAGLGNCHQLSSNRDRPDPGCAGLAAAVIVTTPAPLEPAVTVMNGALRYLAISGEFPRHAPEPRVERAIIGPA
jgi:hypothetical protein